MVRWGWRGLLSSPVKSSMISFLHRPTWLVPAYKPHCQRTELYGTYGQWTPFISASLSAAWRRRAMRAAAGGNSRKMRRGTRLGDGSPGGALLALLRDKDLGLRSRGPAVVWLVWRTYHICAEPHHSDLLTPAYGLRIAGNPARPDTGAPSLPLAARTEPTRGALLPCPTFSFVTATIEHPPVSQPKPDRLRATQHGTAPFKHVTMHRTGAHVGPPAA